MDRVVVQHRTRWLGVGLSLAVALLHFVEAPEYYDEVRYIGILFVLNAIGALVAAIGIQRQQRWGWTLGALMAAGAFVAYVVSRTVGLPGFHETGLEEMIEPAGVLSLAVEAAFMAVWYSVVSGRAQERTAMS